MAEVASSGEAGELMNGVELLAWIVGLTFLFLCYRTAIWFDRLPVQAGECSRLDELDGLPHGVVEHEARMDARAERLGMPR